MHLNIELFKLKQRLMKNLVISCNLVVIVVLFIFVFCIIYFFLNQLFKTIKMLTIYGVSIVLCFIKILYGSLRF